MTLDTTTRDAFLGGRVVLRQPRNGYRAATDPVFLAAACPAKAGEHVLELGCGVGAAALCLATRVAGVQIIGVERQPDYAALARENAAVAGADLQIVQADLTALPADLRQMQFDHVIANPPYFGAGEGSRAKDAGREAANREDTPLADWIAVARARLKPGGWYFIEDVHPALYDQWREVFAGLDASMDAHDNLRWALLIFRKGA